MEDNRIKIVNRTQVYLTDPEFFCNKSWTLSFNMNVKSWTSFHSYIPNWYIAENNFFYSGINGCCSDIEGEGFSILAGTMKPNPITTTTTSTTMIVTTTTTTAIPIDCTLTGVVFQTSCELDGIAIITVPPTTTTTICARPSGLLQNLYFRGYQIGSEPIVSSLATAEDACNAMALTRRLSSQVTSNAVAIGNSVGVYQYNASFDSVGFITTPQLNQFNYIDYSSTSCDYLVSGWYFTPQSWADTLGGTYNKVINIINGYVSEIVDCECGINKQIPNIAPTISECCGILLANSFDQLFYLDPINVITNITPEGFESGNGITMTQNYLWSISTDINLWDIYLTPFSAVYNRVITLPGGYTITGGFVAKDDDTLIVSNSAVSPVEIAELDVTDSIAIDTVIFTLAADRDNVSNMLYTMGEKLIMINQDTMTSDYYITQYDYPTTTLELDINIGTTKPTSLYECNCSLYIIYADGKIFVIEKTAPNNLAEVSSIGISPISAAQVRQCVVSSLTDNANITTTTTSTTMIITTTTTTTI